MSNILLTPFQLLELNVISAQDIAQLSRKMRTYAVVWVHPDRKLSTRVDVDGGTNPTWNDKFVFRVDDEFLYGDTSAIMIEIYAVHWLRDVHVGTVRVIVGNLIPPTRPHHHHKNQLGMRFIALQVRRRSGRPQGILNIGVTLLDSSMRSMPLYSQISTSAVGYLQLMGGEADPHHHNKHDGDKNSDIPSYFFLHSQPFKSPHQLRRTMSDSSSMMASSMLMAAARREKINNKKASSVIDGSAIEKKSNSNQKRRSKPSCSTSSGSEIVKKGIKFEPGSLATGSDLLRYGSEAMDAPPDKATRSPNSNSKHGTLKKINYPTIPLISESDLGPSASEVVAAMAKNNKRNNNRMAAETESEGTAGGAWSLDIEGSIEGLQSKLDRWRSEVPPVFDRSELPSYSDQSELPPGGKKGAAGGHSRRHSTDGSRLFSCFSVICGMECSIVCGRAPVRDTQRRAMWSRRRTAFE